MSGDLIERAAARLSGKPGRAAEARAEPRPAVVILQRASGEDSPVRDSPVRSAATSDQPVTPTDPATEARKRGLNRRINLDATALSLAGIMTPESDATRIVEEFRVLRRPLLNKAFGTALPHSDRANVIMVTSARPGEGKSFVACNLAMSIASERNREVVLVDSDIHNPWMSRLFGLMPGPGLIDLLASPRSEISDYIIGTNFPNLLLLPSGQSAS